MGCHSLLQGIFLIQGSNSLLLCLLHWQANSFLLSHQGSPELLESDYSNRSDMSRLSPCTSVSSSLGVPWPSVVIARALREHPANTTLLLCALLAARLEPWAN